MNGARHIGPALRRAGRRMTGLVRNRGGHSAVEFALLSVVFMPLLLNVYDAAVLIWARMQVDQAAQVGAQAIYNTCSVGREQPGSACNDLAIVARRAVQSTSLGRNVNLEEGYPKKAYYCTEGEVLMPQEGFASPPSDNCRRFGKPEEKPGDYVTVMVKYDFRPLLAGMSLIERQSLYGFGMHRVQ